MKIANNFTIIALLMLCLVPACTESTKTKEEKALDLIDDYMKSSLVSYDSYEPGSIKIDSAFNNPLIHPEVFKSLDVIMKTEEKLEALEWDLTSAESNYEYKLSMESLNSRYDYRSRDEREWDKKQFMVDYYYFDKDMYKLIKSYTKLRKLFKIKKEDIT